MSKLIDSRLVGKSIRSLRLRNHLSQSDLADRIGYSARNIRRIEANGTASIDVVNVFAGYFNVSALDILEGCPFHLLTIIVVIFVILIIVNFVFFSHLVKFFFGINRFIGIRVFFVAC